MLLALKLTAKSGSGSHLSLSVAGLQELLFEFERQAFKYRVLQWVIVHVRSS